VIEQVSEHLVASQDQLTTQGQSTSLWQSWRIEVLLCNPPPPPKTVMLFFKNKKKQPL